SSGQMAPVGFSSSQSTGTAASQQTGTNSGAQQNTFQPWQQQLQTLLPGLFQNYLKGQVPSSFTAPQQLFDVANANFTKYQDPSLVAEFGAGSPQLAAQRGQMDANLAASQYNQGISNFQNALSSLVGTAMTPYGQTNNQQSQTDANTQ